MSQNTLTELHDYAVRLHKLDKLATLAAKLHLIYEWVKTGHVNLSQFKHLTCEVIVQDVETEAGRITKARDED